ncbi:Gp49 family protein [Photobacterium damselae]|uniref:Gp49 family protein n=1 Tax=Photobacterium damselae TaxID=38293 RepID=UPI0040695DFF
MPKKCDEVIKMMEEAGCTGKRVTKDLIESRIESVEYQTITIAGQQMMFCGIRMIGGFVAVGKPATCIDPSNWRDEIGQKISYDNTFEELWKLEAYRLMAEGYINELVGLGEVHETYIDNKLIDPKPQEASTKLSVFSEYHRRPMINLAHEITSVELETMTLEGGNQASSFATIVINEQVITFTYSQRVNVGDFICHANESDIYHCPKAVFDERHYWPSTPDIPSHLYRMEIECAELSERTKKLSAFIRSDAFSSICDSERVFMQEQAFAMSHYCQALEKRIELATNQK